jgi:amino acid adenylation domain-containing protein
MSEVFEQRIAALSQQQLDFLVARMATAETASEPNIISHEADKSESFPLSFAQQRLWFLDRLEPGNAFYNVPAALRLQGPLDVGALHRSLSEIMRRHEILRSAIVDDGEFARLRVVQAQPLDLPLINLDAVAPEQREHEMLKLVEQEIRRPFDLSTGPLVRARLLRIGEREHVFVLAMHHIVSDGWSIGVFVRELATLYDAFSNGLASPLPELAIQYSDFTRWQRKRLVDGALATQLDYWKQQIDGAAPMLQLPTDRPRLAIQTYRGAHYRTKFSEALTEDLEALCQREGVTLFMALLAAFKSVLFRYAGQASICVGCPIANRNRAETESLIGFFVNTLPIRTDLTGDPSFREMLARVRRGAMGAFEHQDLPFEKLVEELRPERRLSHTPLFQVAFVLQNIPMPPLALANLALTLLEVDCGTSKFDLTLQVTRGKQGLEIDLEYSTDLFEAETMARLVGHLEVLLRAVIDDADLRLGEFPLLGEAERREICSWNATQVSFPGPMLLHSLFERQVDRTPEAVALEFDGRAVSYAELDRRATRAAHHLRRVGVVPDRLVGIHAERSVAMVVCLLGVLKAGGAYLPLDPTYPRDRLTLMASDPSVSVVMTQSHLSCSLPATSATLVSVDHDGFCFDAESSERLVVDIDPDNLAYAIYTSGSTGKPKAALNSHRGICNRLLWMQDAYRLTDADRVLQKTPLSFDVSVWEVFWPLITGARLVVARPEGHQDAAYLVELVARQRVTVIHFVPSMLRAFLNEPGLERCDGLRTVICSGEALGVDLRDSFFKRIPARLHNLYGPTEAAIDVTAGECTPHGSGHTVPIGLPIANVRIHLLDAGMQMVPFGVVGELYIAGVAVGRGYLSRPGATAERFVPDPFGDVSGSRMYRTGDLARRQPDGSLEFLGRVDFQVKIRGFRIELGEIESVLAQHPDVSEAVVVARGNAPDNMRLVAYWVAQGPHVRSATELRKHLAELLPDHMVPTRFVQIEALPLSHNGKVDRGALPESEGTRADLSRPYAPPRSPLEERLAGVWARLLDIEEVGIHDDFFELGGHSLLGIQLVSRVREAFHVEIPLRQIFLARSVAEFAAVIRRTQIESAGSGDRPDASWLEPAVVPDRAHRHDPFPLNDVQQAYWVGRRAEFELGNVASHLYLEIDATAIDLTALNAALAQLIRRHDMLRAVILADGMQQILADVPSYDIAYVDLQEREPAATVQVLAEIREEMSHQVRAGDRWPLFEIRASRLDRDRLRLHISLDLLIGDALSWLIFLKELGELARTPGDVAAPLELSFRDYVLAEQQLRQTAAYRRASDYWNARLPTLPPAPELPLIKQGAAPTRPRFSRLEGALEHDIWRGLKRRAAKAGITPSGLLIAAFADILAVWSRSPQFTINLTLFNRIPMHSEVNDIIGDFTSLTLLAVDASFRASFELRAQRLQGQLWDDLDHRQFSAVKVLREFARMQGNPFKASMPVVFSSLLAQTGQRYDTKAIGKLGELAYVITQTPQLYLDHQVYEDEGRLRFNWDAVEAMFPPSLLDDMFEAYCGHLNRLALEESAWQETTLPSAPKSQIDARAVINATEAESTPELLHTAIAARAARYPDRVAVMSSTRSWSYADLWQASNQVGHWLRHRGARPGMLVAVMMEKGWEQVVAVLGVLRSGAAYLPIDPGYPAERVQFLLEHGQVGLVLTQAAVDARLCWPRGVERYRVDEAALPNNLDDLAPIQRQDDLAYVIYTSGSTGVPKGVAIDHRGALNTINDINRRFAVGPDDRLLALSSLGFDLSVYDVFGILGAGGTIVLPDPTALRDPAHWTDLATRAGVTIWNSVPALMSLAVEYGIGRDSGLPPSLRLVLLSGDWIPTSLPDEIRRTVPHARVVSLGGATEASIWSIHYPIGDVDPSWQSIPYGWPMANQRCHVLDKALEPRPVWVAGDLYIGGIGLARGYWRDEERTAAAFITHPKTGERLYRTGDIGRYLPDGSIEFLGRDDLLVKIRGYRIELGEIEAVLTKHPSVRAAVVVARDGSSSKVLMAYVILRQGVSVDGRELRTFLAEKLPDYMVPATVMVMEALPLTANGKVDAKALPWPATSTVKDPAVPAAETATAIGRIRTLVANLLDRVEVEPDTNLLELGINSVDVVRIANLLEREFGFRLKFEDFYRAPTVRGLAALHARRIFDKKSVDEIPPAAARFRGEGISAFEMLIDPVLRNELKQRRVWLRRDRGTLSVALPAGGPTEALRVMAGERQLQRHFAGARVGLTALGELLGSLCHVAASDDTMSVYPSFGECFPIQVYLHVKPGRVDGLDCGTYYHDPLDHRLNLLSSDANITRSVHAPFVYQPVFDEAAFSIFLIAQFDAIGPIYGEHAHRLCLLEAGHMSQVLMETAAACGIGLCPVGVMDFEPIRRYFALGKNQVLIHSFLGGSLADEPSHRDAAHHSDVANWEVGEL